MPGNTDNVANIQLFHQIVRRFVKVFARCVALHAARLIHCMEEGHLAEGAQRNNAPGNGDDVFLAFEGFAFQVAKFVQYPGDGVLFSKIIGKEGHARIQQIAGFNHAVFYDFVKSFAAGEAFQHGHEIARVLRLGA